MFALGLIHIYFGLNGTFFNYFLVNRHVLCLNGGVGLNWVSVC